MKNKPIIIVLIVLFLVFVAIWIASPRVGEKVDINTGVSLEFDDKDFDLPDNENLPDGYVRILAITDAVVYSKTEGDTTHYYEFIGNNKYVEYDIERPPYLVKTNFDKRIYQIKSENNSFADEYRAYDGKVWQVVSKDYNVLFTIPDNYVLSAYYPNLYFVNEKDNYSYKLLTKIGTQYAWLKPVESTEWINTTIPDGYEKTKTTNVYKGKIDGKDVYKKVLLFSDANKTVVVVTCDKNGKVF
jgi:hypothetical protein